jgi:hypothetical protein
VQPFAAGRERAGRLELAGLTAAEVTAFVLAACPGRPKGTAKLTVTALRSLLSFVHIEGMIIEPLAQAVPAVASWRLASLPRALEPGRVAALLASCDRRTPAGRRDFAMLTLLARLRAGEVTGSAWMTSAGGLARSPSAARTAVLSGCRCPPTWARRSPPIWPMAAGAARGRPAGLPAGAGTAFRAEQRRRHPGGVRRGAACRDRPGIVSQGLTVR